MSKRRCCAKDLDNLEEAEDTGITEGEFVLNQNTTSEVVVAESALYQPHADVKAQYFNFHQSFTTLVSNETPVAFLEFSGDGFVMLEVGDANNVTVHDIYATVSKELIHTATTSIHARMSVSGRALVVLADNVLYRYENNTQSYVWTRTLEQSPVVNFNATVSGTIAANADLTHIAIGRPNDVPGIACYLYRNGSYILHQIIETPPTGTAFFGYVLEMSKDGKVLVASHDVPARTIIYEVDDNLKFQRFATLTESVRMLKYAIAGNSKTIAAVSDTNKVQMYQKVVTFWATRPQLTVIAGVNQGVAISSDASILVVTEPLNNSALTYVLFSNAQDYVLYDEITTTGGTVCAISGNGAYIATVRSDSDIDVFKTTTLPDPFLVTSLTATGSVRAAVFEGALGTESAPTYTTNFDSDSGIYFSAADELSISNGGDRAHTFNRTNVELLNPAGAKNVTIRSAGGAVTVPTPMQELNFSAHLGKYGGGITWTSDDQAKRIFFGRPSDGGAVTDRLLYNVDGSGTGDLYGTSDNTVCAITDASSVVFFSNTDAGFRVEKFPRSLGQILFQVNCGTTEKVECFRPHVLARYTLATVPPASDYDGSFIFATDVGADGLPLYAANGSWRSLLDGSPLA